MTARDWKPGDVAAVSGPAPFVDHGANYAEMVEVVCHFTDGGFWRPVGRDAYGFLAHEARSVRPLVVIDPEDHGDAFRVLSAWFGHGNATAREVEKMQTALRSLLESPKPEEPTGLGAVVEAIYDNRFVRVQHEDPAWRRVGDPAEFGLYNYAGIAVVRILSEGVTA